MVRCKEFSMKKGWSPWILLGMTPKITFECGSCSAINDAHLSIQAIKNNKQHIFCGNCRQVNRVPVELEQ